MVQEPFPSCHFVKCILIGLIATGAVIQHYTNQMDLFLQGRIHRERSILKVKMHHNRAEHGQTCEATAAQSDSQTYGGQQPLVITHVWTRQQCVLIEMMLTHRVSDAPEARFLRLFQKEVGYLWNFKQKGASTLKLQQLRPLW